MRVTVDVVDAGFAEARACYERGDTARAESLLRRLIAQAPEREDVAELLAEVLRSQGRLGAAATTMLALAERSGFDATVALHAAAFARECDRHAVAARICAGALARGARIPELLVVAGHVARELGDFEAARAHYLAALDAGIDLDRHNVLGSLVNTKRYVDTADPDLARCETRFRDSACSVRSRASSGYALAKVLDDLGDPGRAAAVLREANSLARAAQPWAADAWRRLVVERQRENVATRTAPVPADFMPVFVVGVPRSGTTLTATQLARATDARDRGELRALRFIAERLRSGGHLGNAAALGEAVALYRVLARQDDAPARWYLDQDPLNFRYLDIAVAMFPQARIVHVRRDPRDTALSLWSQDFAHPDMGFANDFMDIAEFMAGHDALMAHWKRTLPVPVHDVDYESLVADPGGTVARLAAFIGAPLRERGGTDAVPVTSASVWQARQPLYTTSVERWRRYAPFVPELENFDKSA